MRLTRTFNICFTLWRIDLSKNAYRNIAIYLTNAHENSKCNLHRNVTAIRYRNDVIRSVLLHIRANLGMMLVRDYASCHVARNTIVMSVANNVHYLRWPVKNLDLNPIDCLLDILKR